jgi:hypothetical protein
MNPGPELNRKAHSIHPIIHPSDYEGDLREGVVSVECPVYGFRPPGNALFDS